MTPDHLHGPHPRPVNLGDVMIYIVVWDGREWDSGDALVFGAFQTFADAKRKALEVVYTHPGKWITGPAAFSRSTFSRQGSSVMGFCEHCGHGPTCVVCGRDDRVGEVRVCSACLAVVTEWKEYGPACVCPDCDTPETHVGELDAVRMVDG